MKVTNKKMGNAMKKVHVYVLSDLHIGDTHCDIKEIKQRIEIIQKDRLGVVLLNGDLINNAVKSSPSDVYGEAMTPTEQLLLILELFKPIKNKIVGITQGNHEARTYKNDGIDITKLLSKELGIEESYSSDGLLLFLTFGEQSRRKSESRPITYSLYMTHGSGGGKKAGGKINGLADMAGVVDADIYVRGHTHLPAALKEDFIRVSPTNRSVKQVDKLFVNSSATLSYGGYGESLGFKPSNTSMPIIELDGTKRNMRVIF